LFAAVEALGFGHTAKLTTTCDIINKKISKKRSVEISPAKIKTKQDEQYLNDILCG
jgi:hypothetical protein